MNLNLDKAKHIAVGALLTLIGMALGGLVAFAIAGDVNKTATLGSVIGMMVGVLVGFAKEDYDRKRPLKHTKDGWDAYATALGSTWMNFVLCITLYFVK